MRLRVFRALERYDDAHPTSREHIHRAILLTRPLSLDDGETAGACSSIGRGEIERLFAVDLEPDMFVLDADRVPSTALWSSALFGAKPSRCCADRSFS